ncbi:TonB-dependent receptor, partial [uncultured Pseudoalteromonas sp.]|uniref:TonB-dependent receptor domain-containing protein n=1 Tax=uncultured Pseudoalteromonas sp. TaxID=114053 RepID=UPI00260F3EE4
YATYTQGYKSGTFNTVNVYDEPEYVRPETVTTKEIGLKSQFFDQGLTMNFAIFENEIEDLQVQFISLLSGGAVSLENAGGARIRGIDFDSQWVPMPDMNPGLVLALTGSYLDSEYTSYVNGSGYNEGDGFYNNRQGDFTGNRVTRTPKFSGSFGLNQVIAGWTEGLQLMSEGDKFTFYIPPQLAYGRKRVGSIPAGSLLIFDVELIKIES